MPEPPGRWNRGADRARRLAPWAAYALLLAAAPWCWPGPLALTMLSQIAIGIVACLSFNILLGQGGMISFGHAVYTGLGAYGAMHALNALSHGAAGLPVSLVPLVGGAVGMACAAVLGGLNTRGSGTAFAMVSLGLGELVAAGVPLAPGFFGGEGGIAGNRVAGSAFLGIDFGPQRQVYGLIATYAFVCTLAMYGLTRTPFGLLLNAVRDNAARVGFLGGNARRVRHLAFVIAGFFAGVAGGLAALNFEIATPEMVGTARSGSYLLFTVLGGTAVFVGPMIGAVLMVLAGVALAGLTASGWLYVGLGFMGVVMLAPGGLASVGLAAWRLRAHGRLRGVVPGGLVLIGAAAVAFAGFAAMVEMIYQRQFAVGSGTSLAVFGVPLDANGVDAWVGAALLLLTGGGLFELVRRRLAAELGAWP